MRDPIVREFVFFDSADKPLFVRTDAEQATWQVDEYSLTCNFPFVADKRIERGMRVSFDDEDGVHQFFEVRKVKTYTPDGYQELTCEHIVISELTDVHTAEQPLTDVTPAAAVQAALAAQTQTGVLCWQVGDVDEAATATSSGDIGLGSVWQNIRSIEQNWNVYVLPRVTYNTTGITGRYLDIIPADSANRWQGMRLSIDKNMDEAGVTVDDTDVKTALYGYGGTAYTYNDPEHGTDPLDKKGTKIDLKGATWSSPPANATLNNTLGYIEDTAATAAYGRNGKPRFGFYQSSDITDQGTLILKTWEALQATNKPRVTIDCMLRDLYRMGYDDEPVRLHDLVQVELLPVHDNLRLEIIKLSVDLLDPTATRPTIGVYIPNIVYIQRQTAYNAAGGVSSTLSGRRGGGRSGGQTKAEAEWSEFQAGIEANNMIISLHAEQVDRSNNILKQAGVAIDADGVIAYAGNNLTDMKGQIEVNSDRVAMVVGTNKDGYFIEAASIATSINEQSEGIVSIDADRVWIDADKQVKINDSIFIAKGGNFWIKRIAQFGTTSLVTINGGTVNAPTLQVNSCGDLKFAGSSQSQGVITINRATAADLITGVQIVGPTNDVYTLQYQKVGTGSTWNNASVTFSRATTLSGAWSSGVFTVAASPQNQYKWTSLTQGTASWSGKTVTIPIYATIDSGAVVFDTGKTVSATYSGSDPVTVNNWQRTNFTSSTQNYGTGTRSLSIPVKVDVNGVTYSHTFTTGGFKVVKQDSTHMMIYCGSTELGVWSI